MTTRSLEHVSTMCDTSNYSLHIIIYKMGDDIVLTSLNGLNCRVLVQYA